MILEGFSSDTIEKMERLCDLLSAVQNADFIKERLSLYGGTALNFLYFDQARLSEDLDFNYRHIDEEDWGEVLDRIDKDLKWVINSLGYKEEDIKINSLYNLGRFHLNYISDAGTKDDIKIEIGYMRRSPNLNEDSYRNFNHLTKGEEIKVKTPVKEELFANKFATMISRSKPFLNLRDIFDVYSISKHEFDHRTFFDLVALEVMMMDLSFSTISKIKEQLMKGKSSGKIEHLIKGDFALENIIPEVITFSEETIHEIAVCGLDAVIDHFYSTGEMVLEGFNSKEKLHPDIQKHPQLQWLKTKRMKSNTK